MDYTRKIHFVKLKDPNQMTEKFGNLREGAGISSKGWGSLSG